MLVLCFLEERKTAQITVLNKYLRKVLTRLTIYLHMYLCVSLVLLKPFNECIMKTEDIFKIITTFTLWELNLNLFIFIYEI